LGSLAGAGFRRVEAITALHHFGQKGSAKRSLSKGRICKKEGRGTKKKESAPELNIRNKGPGKGR